MASPYADIQARMGRFGASILGLLPALKEAGVPGSTIDQLTRSSVSIGSNYAEARGAESHADFLHKLQVALKEAREALHQLDIIAQLPEGPQQAIIALWRECDQFCAILFSSVRTAKLNGRQRLCSG